MNKDAWIWPLVKKMFKFGKGVKNLLVWQNMFDRSMGAKGKNDGKDESEMWKIVK